MRKIIFFLSVAASCNLQGQILTPGKESFESKWIKPEKKELLWLGVKDTSLVEIGKIITEIIPDEERILVLMKVDIKNMPAPWTDSTAVEISTLKPLFHSSTNAQRDMRLSYGKQVTGFYHNKLKNFTKQVDDAPQSEYFDSSFYQILIRWLPLEEGYNKTISLYDLGADGNTGQYQAFVTDVRSGQYKTAKSGNRNVWIVTVYDNIGGKDNGMTHYYIDKETRALWQQEMNVGSQKMYMRTIE